MKITTKILLAGGVFAIVLFTSGCEQRYRYTCQDIANWDKPECQKPLCAVHKDCPSHIFKNDPDLADHIKN
jgi:hypothetical protein